MPYKTGTSKRKLQTAMRTQQVLEMRLAGATFRQIAETLELSVGRVHEIVSEQMKMTPVYVERAVELQAMEVARLDRMQMRAWQKFEASGQNGTPLDMAAAELILKVIRLRADLLGLRHINIHHTVEEVPSLEDLSRELDAYNQGVIDAQSTVQTRE